MSKDGYTNNDKALTIYSAPPPYRSPIIIDYDASKGVVSAVTPEQLSREMQARSSSLGYGLGVLLRRFTDGIGLTKPELNRYASPRRTPRRVKVLNDGPPKYETVLVLGPAVETQGMSNKVLDAYKSKDIQFKVVGNGFYDRLYGYETTLTKDMILKLKDRISPNARVDINIHGIVKDDDSKHYLSLGKDNGFSKENLVRTSEFFKIFSKILGEDFRGSIHLISCYGGAAEEVVDILPKKARYFRHETGLESTLKAVGLKIILNGIQRYPKGNDLEISPLHLSLVTGDKQVSCIMETPNRVLNSPQDLKQHIIQQLEDCNDESIQIELSELNVSKEEFESYQKDFFMMKIQRKDYDAIREMLEKGLVDPNLELEDGLSPIFFAITNEDDKLVSILLEQPEINLNAVWMSKMGRLEVVDTAFMSENDNIIRMILEDERLRVIPGIDTEIELKAMNFAIRTSHIELMKEYKDNPNLVFQCTNDRGKALLQMLDNSDPEALDFALNIVLNSFQGKYSSSILNKMKDISKENDDDESLGVIEKYLNVYQEKYNPSPTVKDPIISSVGNNAPKTHRDI